MNCVVYWEQDWQGTWTGRSERGDRRLGGQTRVVQWPLSCLEASEHQVSRTLSANIDVISLVPEQLAPYLAIRNTLHQLVKFSRFYCLCP